MHYWKNLNLVQKLLVGLLIIAMVIMMPELLPLIDIGGIELIFGFVVLNVKHISHWLRAKQVQVNDIINIVAMSFTKSAIGKPKTFIYHAGVCTCVLFITGSLVLSVSFLLPVMLANGLLI